MFLPTSVYILNERSIRRKREIPLEVNLVFHSNEAITATNVPSKTLLAAEEIVVQ